MKKENVALGLKNIYRGEAIGLIATLILNLSLIVVGVVSLGTAAADAAASLSEDLEAIFGMSFLVLIAMIVIGLVIAVIGFIKEIKGLKQVGTESKTFQTAFYFVIFCLILTFVAGLLKERIPMLSTIASGMEELLDVSVSYYVVKGCIELFAGTTLEQKGRKLMKWLFAFGIVRALCSSIGGMQGGMVAVLNIANVVLTVVFYVFYLSYLSRARELAENSLS